MIPFPLPPLLARLHTTLEAYTDGRERGFFMAEQDRNRQARSQPVLLYIRPENLDEEKSSPTPRPPDWMAELVSEDSDERLKKYASAGVCEFWRVFLEEGRVRIEVHRQPNTEASRYEQLEVFTDEEPLSSPTFPELLLKPRDLLGSGEVRTQRKAPS